MSPKISECFRQMRREALFAVSTDVKPMTCKSICPITKVRCLKLSDLSVRQSPQDSHDQTEVDLKRPNTRGFAKVKCLENDCSLLLPEIGKCYSLVVPRVHKFPLTLYDRKFPRHLVQQAPCTSQNMQVADVRIFEFVFVVASVVQKRPDYPCVGSR
jgi:hypothetical protein